MVGSGRKQFKTRSQETVRRQTAERRGRHAETLAIAYMRLKGYRLIAHRARTPAGEIDAVMRRGGEFVFLEVKQRSHLDDALAALSPHQQKRLLGGATHWLGAQGLSPDTACRFDLVCIVPWRWPIHLTNILSDHRQ